MPFAASGQDRFIRCAVCLAAAGLVAGCAPIIHVENKTPLPVRALVTQYGGQHVKGGYRWKNRQDEEGVSVGKVWDRFRPGFKRLDIHETLRLQPGGGGSVVAIEGKYDVYVWPENEWELQVNTLRAQVEAGLKDPNGMTREQLAALSKLLVNFVPDAAVSASFCKGTVGNFEEDVNAQITLVAASSLNVTCSSTSKSESK
jgi:hypothetical protein